MTSSQPDRDDRLQKKTEPSVVLAGCVQQTGTTSQRTGPDHVAEHHADVATLRLRLRGGFPGIGFGGRRHPGGWGRKRETAIGTELRRRRIGITAGGTGAREGRPALHAKLEAVLDDGLAAGTLHRASFPQSKPARMNRTDQYAIRYSAAVATTTHITACHGRASARPGAVAFKARDGGSAGRRSSPSPAECPRHPGSGPHNRPCAGRRRCAPLRSAPGPGEQAR